MISNYSSFLEEKSKAEQNGKPLYILYFSFTKHHKTQLWYDTIGWLKQYIREKQEYEDFKGDDENFIAVETDMLPNIMANENISDGLKISLLINSKYAREDVLLDYKKLEGKCVVRCHARMEFNDEETFSAALPIKFRCPGALLGGNCGKNEHEWYCGNPNCMQTIKLDKDGNFCCECGHLSASMYKFKCSSNFHGPKYLDHNSQYLEKVSKETRNEEKRKNDEKESRKNEEKEPPQSKDEKEMEDDGNMLKMTPDTELVELNKLIDRVYDGQARIQLKEMGKSEEPTGSMHLNIEISNYTRYFFFCPN